MQQAPLILVCDHRGEGLAETALALEASGWRIVLSGSLRQTLDNLARGEPALAMIDPLAAGGALELEALARARPPETPVPILVVVDARDPLPAAVATRALGSSPWDLVRRDAPPQEYAMRVQLLLAHARRLAEMSELRHRASHDDRTDLLRPASFQERLQEHFSAAQRHGLDLALLILDLDAFGQINKQHDHTVGDRLIERVGDVIRAALRTEDVAGRLGGDEFAVLLPYTRKVDAAHVAQRLLEEISALSGPLPGARSDVQVSASIGFETFDGTDMDSVETLRLHAEEALQQAKRRGGNQGAYYRGLAAEGGGPT